MKSGIGSKQIWYQVHIKDFPIHTEKAWVVGFAMGSTEKQDLRAINKELEPITGVTGTKCLYQYLYHRNVTPALWKEALAHEKIPS